MLGLHIQTWGPGVLDSVLRARGRVLKVMAPDVDPVHKVLEQRPDTIIVCRRYFDDGEQRKHLGDGDAGGRYVADLVADTFVNIVTLCREFGATVYVEGLNEIGLWDDAGRYNQFTVGFAEVCHRRFLKPAVYSFATGNPPGYKDGSPDDLRAYWAHYLDGLRTAKRAGGALALHEYDAPDMRRIAGWLCLRYRKVYDILPDDLKELPLLITETGIDGGVIQAPSAAAAGWRNYATAQEYAEQLRWYAGELAKDSYVLGATVFTAGNADMWGSFDVTGVGEVLDAIAAGAPQGGTMPKKTVITPLGRGIPAGQPGGSTVLSIRASGIDGLAKGFADVAYPVLPGNEFGATYGPNLTTEIGPFGDGDAHLRIQIPEATHPLPTSGVTGEVMLRIVELDGQTFDGGQFGPFQISIGAQVADQPAASGDWRNSPDLPAFTELYNAAHALEANAHAGVSRIGREVVALVEWWKGGMKDTDHPFAKTSEKSKR